MITKSLVETIMEQMETHNGEFNESLGKFSATSNQIYNLGTAKTSLQNLRKELNEYDNEMLKRDFLNIITRDPELSHTLQKKPELINELMNNPQLLKVIIQNDVTFLSFLKKQVSLIDQELPPIVEKKTLYWDHPPQMRLLDLRQNAGSNARVQEMAWGGAACFHGKKFYETNA